MSERKRSDDDDQDIEGVPLRGIKTTQIFRRLLRPGVEQAQLLAQAAVFPPDEVPPAGVEGDAIILQQAREGIFIRDTQTVLNRILRMIVLQTEFQVTKTLGYDNHLFTSFAYVIAANGTERDIISDLGAAEIPEQIIVSPTTEARVEFDSSIDAVKPSILADQSLTAPLHARKIRAQGVALAGTLKVFSFW